MMSERRFMWCHWYCHCHTHGYCCVRFASYFDHHRNDITVFKTFKRIQNTLNLLAERKSCRISNYISSVCAFLFRNGRPVKKMTVLHLNPQSIGVRAYFIFCSAIEKTSERSSHAANKLLNRKKVAICHIINKYT